ncbi:hypothetical protein BT96DRAFT_998493 [Gymnopus androsaceus JB14]|uniref:Uncharacterized protein n=1 Tax=Gymnopus androsaceus JB14 TaxID=1447944 RepID=A0A6A4H8C8_9AGAR|nr:hypothetical protein BT96DRAFT_998493 [Gymnopus androsaceus JB14]
MVTRFLLGLREMNNKKIITDSEFTPSFSVSGPVAFAPNPNPGIKNKHFHRRVPRSPRQRRFGDSSLLKDFADYENVEGLSEESTEFTRTQFSAKEVYNSVGSHQLDSISRPIEELIVRGRRVEEGLNHEEESIITNSPS